MTQKIKSCLLQDEKFALYIKNIFFSKVKSFLFKISEFSSINNNNNLFVHFMIEVKTTCILDVNRNSVSIIFFLVTLNDLFSYMNFYYILGMATLVLMN